MILNTANTVPNLKANWAPIIAAMVAAWAYFSPLLTNMISSHPNIAVWVALGSAVVTFYSKSPLATAPSAPAEAPPIPTTLTPASVSKPVVLSTGQAGTITGYARKAGFSGSDLVTAVAIAYAESAGNPLAIGDTNLGGSYGLWQINLLAHPSYSASNLFNPQYNADVAYAVYVAAGRTFTPWSTFNNGTYQTQLAKAREDAAA